MVPTHLDCLIVDKGINSFVAVYLQYLLTLTVSYLVRESTHLDCLIVDEGISGSVAVYLQYLLTLTVS